MPGFGRFCPVLVFLIGVAYLSDFRSNAAHPVPPLARRPPVITKQGPFENIFKAGDPVTIPCQANGSPMPSYRWMKDDKLLDPGLISAADDGSLTLMDTSEADEGDYQCYASNSYGVAVSIRTILRMAVLDPFPSVFQEKVHRIGVGRPLTLHCNQPLSYPPGVVYWAESKKDSKLITVETNERIALDYHGHLHFANVLPEDRRGNVTYVCVNYNTVLRSLVQGDDQKIEPQRTPGSSRQEPPRLAFSSSIPEVALKGQTKKLRCFYSGMPTPTIFWKRIEGEMPEKAYKSSSDQELVIPNVEFEDAGRYQCEGVNPAGSSSKDIFMVVESPPYWRNGRPPDDVVASEEDDVIIYCLVNGVPKPTITWLINAKPLIDIPENPRRVIGQDFVKIDNVTGLDTQVIQCNASNSHGYLFANVFISVQAEPPSFIEAPPKEIRLSVGQSAILKCRAFGAPEPEIAWKSGRLMDDVIGTDASTGTLDGGATERSGHLEILDNGDLSIKNARREEEDIYFCRIGNKFGSDFTSTKVFVRERTKIVDRPEDQTVLAGSENVIFRCNASTDPEERERLVIEWSKNGVSIDADEDDDDDADGGGGGGGGGSVGDGDGEYHRRVSVIDRGRRLIIRNPRANDTGSYTCRAFNGLDVDSHTAKLIVKGPPDPPRNVRLISCSADSAEVSWTPGRDNSDPTSGFIVYVNTSHDEPGKYEEGARVNVTTPAGRYSVRVQLKPWTNSSFYVVAENAIGQSGKSESTGSVCSTPPAKPQRNPRRVCTDSKNSGQLVIVWEPMLRSEHNGPDFHYVVSYRRLGLTSPAAEILRQVSDWRQSELVVDENLPFHEYEISVQAVNNVGPAHGTPDRIIGYSGEDDPLERPRNFQLIDETLNDTSARFTWEPVNEDRKVIRGFFQGYQIRFWKSADPTNVRTEDIIVHKWTPCRLVSQRHGHVTTADHSSIVKRMTPSIVDGLTNRLWPFATITAGVLVISGTKMGQLSDAIEFTTPEGVPDVVPAFWVSERGAHHLRLSWSAPFEVNGVLKGYGIAYKEAPPAIDTWKETYITYPELTYRKIHDLKSDTVYAITIWAETNAGRGQELTIEETTVSEDVPDKPIIESIETGYDFVNVSWRPSGDGPPRSPGSDFIVEYRLLGNAEWEQSGRERQHNWVNVTGLKHGNFYEFRVISLNKKGDAMRSEVTTARVGLQHAAIIQEASSRGWVAAVVLVFFIAGAAALAAFGVVKRNRGGIYPVYKKEKMNGTDKKNDREPAFGEYMRTEDSGVKSKSQASLETSTTQSQDDATDSLGIYDDGTSSKFNDEGSIAPLKPTETEPEHASNPESHTENS